MMHFRAAHLFDRGIAAIAAALGLSVLALTPASAQNWPQRNITLIVSQSAGASPDVMARMITDRLSETLKQGVLVENKPGADNIVGATAAARAAPDGYTFFFATSAALVTNPFLTKSLPYDPLKDFTPVALVTRSNQMLVASADLPVKTLPELIALDKKDPGKLSIAVDGPRNLAGVTALALNKAAGTSFTLVPYPNITVGLQDVVAGRVQLGIFSVSIAEALIRDGKLRAIAGISANRQSAFPDLPIAAETLPGFDLYGWFMVMAPTGTPVEIVNKMNQAIAAAAKDSRVAAMAPKLGFEIDAKGIGSPAEAAKFLVDQTALWKKTTSDLGIERQ